MPEKQQAQKSSDPKSNIQKQATLPKQILTSHPAAIIQRARINPKSLTPSDVLQLQRTIGNRAVVSLLSEIGLIPSKAKQTQPVQMQTMPEEEKESLQGKFTEPIQRQEIPEEEEPLQGKFESGHEKEICPSCIQRQEIPEEEEPLQGKMTKTTQLQEIPEEEEPLQGKFESIQRQEIPEEEGPLQRKRENNTGMPDNLKTGVENLSGIDMSDVRVHYNSLKPAEVGALAYTQGTNIHIAPGQERHLPHEAWHVVQQAQGRVRPTMQMKGGVKINDNVGLEDEATGMGSKAVQKHAQIQILKGKISIDKPEMRDMVKANSNYFRIPIVSFSSKETIQRQPKTIEDLETFATYKPFEEIDTIIKSQPACLAIEATHTGDMYHLKAVKSMYPTTNILIWGVSKVGPHKSIDKAFDIASYLGNKEKKSIYYSDGGKPVNIATSQNLSQAMKTGLPGGIWIDEGGATSVIMYTLKNEKYKKPDLLGVIAEGVAPIEGRESKYEKDLLENGFKHGPPYVLVNFRQSGRTGGTAPALDTGISGYNQIIISLSKKLPGVIAVPMGEYQPPGQFPANLITYWNWPCCNDGRKAQAGLLRYLNTNFNVIGAIGMRSGIMDSLAFSGIKILSIDISPSKKDDTSKGWERGDKLESVLSEIYGRAFITKPRRDEKNLMLPWEGTFDPTDVETIERAMVLFLSTKDPIRPYVRDKSHPLSQESLEGLITAYKGKKPTRPDIEYMQAVLKQLKVTYNFKPNRLNRSQPDFIDEINNLLPEADKLFTYDGRKNRVWK